MGYRADSLLYDAGSDDYYWSRTLYDGNPYSAHDVYFNSEEVYWYYDGRNIGFSVRAVRVPQN